jgi:hypothetical protein
MLKSFMVTGDWLSKREANLLNNRRFRWDREEENVLSKGTTCVFRSGI